MSKTNIRDNPDYATRLAVANAIRSLPKERVASAIRQCVSSIEDECLAEMVDFMWQAAIIGDEMSVMTFRNCHPLTLLIESQDIAIPASRNLNGYLGFANRTDRPTSVLDR